MGADGDCTVLSHHCTLVFLYIEAIFNQPDSAEAAAGPCCASRRQTTGDHLLSLHWYLLCGFKILVGSEVLWKDGLLKNDEQWNT